jgi:hypothetical protein
MRGASEKVRAVHNIGQTTQNPASPSEKWGLGIQFMASPYFGVYESQRNFNPQISQITRITLIT